MDISVSYHNHVFITCILVISYSILSFELDRKTYIVRVDHESKPEVFPTLNHWYESSLASDDNVGASGGIIYTYDTVLHGFSAKLSAEEARKLERTNGVLSVVPEQVRRLQTTRTPEFLGLKRSGNGGLLKESAYGSNIIIGVIDSGIWPERESFHDRDLGPVPSKWKGECIVEDDFPATLCNRKLIGARYFSKGYEGENYNVNQTSPRDYDGHGTSTASIAAGRLVSSASFFGYAEGVAAGVAPKARLAVYKACWDNHCYDSDLLAAFEAAIADGVDIISISLNAGSESPYHVDPMAMAAFGASDAGIFVSASAGNYGPNEGSVTNDAPWYTTVGAGSIDRDFPASVKLGNGKTIQGLSIYHGPGLKTDHLYPLIYSGNLNEPGDYPLCEQGSLNPDEVRGKLVVCYMGGTVNLEKGEVVKNAGGVGMILATPYYSNESIQANSHVLPTVSINASSAEEIRKYMLAASQKNSSATGTLRFQGTKLGVKPAPVVASFSSRGPNPGTPEILKPDLIAPGLNILAAWTGSNPSWLPSDDRRTEFNIMSGTSMACPHVSGIAALLKAVHPIWSPAAIRSALITTTYTLDNTNEAIIDQWTSNHATVMDFGAGHVNPQKAMDPGLIYDLTSQDYVAFLCNMNYTGKQIQTITKKYKSCSGVKRSGSVRNFNYPSLSAVFKQRGKANMTAHFDRTVTNVGDPKSVYKVKVTAPGRTLVSVKPNKLAFKSVGEKLSFHVRVEAEAVQLPLGKSSIVTSGSIVWLDGKHVVNSPLVVIMKYP